MGWEATHSVFLASVSFPNCEPLEGRGQWHLPTSRCQHCRPPPMGPVIHHPSTGPPAHSLPIHPSMHPLFCLSTHPPSTIRPSLRPSSDLSVLPSTVHPSIHCSSICLPAHPSTIHLSVYPSTQAFIPSSSSFCFFPTASPLPFPLHTGQEYFQNV